jgi:hypothetical protein
MIKCLQLMNGQDIIGEVEVSQHGVNVKKPAAIHLVPQQDGSSFGIALLPFVPFADGALLIREDKIMIEYEPTVDLRNNYSKMFGTGIQIANIMPGK